MDEPQVSWVDDRNNTSYHPSTPSKKKSKSKKLEFVGWGSKPLIEFLISIGRDTSELISQHDATAIITRYVNDNGLVHPTRKKRINCDERLQAVFGKKTIARNKVHALLEPHYPDSDDELIFSSDEDENDVTSEHRATTPQRKTPPKKKEVETNRSCFAAVIPHNLKFVYLKRSFVLELLNDPQFEEKVVGCYVRVKADPNDYLQKNSHCLLQIKGIVFSLLSLSVGLNYAWLCICCFVKFILLKSAEGFFLINCWSKNNYMRYIADYQIVKADSESRFSSNSNL